MFTQRMGDATPTEGEKSTVITKNTYRGSASSFLGKRARSSVLAALFTFVLIIANNQAAKAISPGAPPERRLRGNEGSLGEVSGSEAEMEDWQPANAWDQLVTVNSAGTATMDDELRERDIVMRNIQRLSETAVRIHKRDMSWAKKFETGERLIDRYVCCNNEPQQACFTHKHNVSDVWDDIDCLYTTTALVPTYELCDPDNPTSYICSGSDLNMTYFEGGGEVGQNCLDYELWSEFKGGNADSLRRATALCGQHRRLAANPGCQEDTYACKGVRGVVPAGSDRFELVDEGKILKDITTFLLFYTVPSKKDRKPPNHKHRLIFKDNYFYRPEMDTEARNKQEKLFDQAGVVMENSYRFPSFVDQVVKGKIAFFPTEFKEFTQNPVNKVDPSVIGQVKAGKTKGSKQKKNSGLENDEDDITQDDDLEEQEIEKKSVKRKKQDIYQPIYEYIADVKDAKIREMLSRQLEYPEVALEVLLEIVRGNNDVLTDHKNPETFAADRSELLKLLSPFIMFDKKKLVGHFMEDSGFALSLVSLMTKFHDCSAPAREGKYEDSNQKVLRQYRQKDNESIMGYTVTNDRLAKLISSRFGSDKKGTHSPSDDESEESEDSKKAKIALQLKSSKPASDDESEKSEDAEVDKQGEATSLTSKKKKKNVAKPKNAGPKGDKN